MSEYISTPALGHRPIEIEASDGGRYVLGVQARLKAGNEIYHKGHFFPGTTMSWYQARATSSRSLFIPHAADGVYDQVLTLHHTYQATGSGVAVNASLRIIADVLTEAGAQSLSFGPVVWQGQLPYDARYFLSPERGSGVIESGPQRVIEIPELRLPYPLFRLELAPAVAPDAGEFQMRITRRQ